MDEVEQVADHQQARSSFQGTSHLALAERLKARLPDQDSRRRLPKTMVLIGRVCVPARAPGCRSPSIAACRGYGASAREALPSSSRRIRSQSTRARPSSLTVPRQPVSPPCMCSPSVRQVRFCDDATWALASRYGISGRAEAGKAATVAFGSVTQVGWSEGRLRQDRHCPGRLQQAQHFCAAVGHALRRHVGSCQATAA